MGELKNKLQEIGASRFHAEDEISVLVELSLCDPDKACIRQLRDAGLKIEEIIGNKVVGRIASEAAGALLSLSIVTSVERSEQLRSH